MSSLLEEKESKEMYQWCSYVLLCIKVARSSTNFSTAVSESQITVIACYTAHMLYVILSIYKLSYGVNA